MRNRYKNNFAGKCQLVDACYLLYPLYAKMSLAPVLSRQKEREYCQKKMLINQRRSQFEVRVVFVLIFLSRINSESSSKIEAGRGILAWYFSELYFM